MAKPVNPEPKFFLNPDPGEFGRQRYLQKWFSKTGNAIAVGEKSTSYMEAAGVPERMKEMFPDLRLIFLVRNPIDRAISNYLFSKSNDLEPESFDTAVMSEDSRIRTIQFPTHSVHPWAYIRRGFYWEQIERFLMYFPKNKLEVILNDDLDSDAESVCRKLFGFLGVDLNFVPQNLNFHSNANRAQEIRIKPTTVQYLRDCFQEKNSKLGKYLHRDLSIWNEPSDSYKILMGRY